ncbi:MAG: hypothetical protein HY755_02305 [Nitrospirae bacterium]|nr:hypothetical protein [Nitrospirota bacterium]
MKKIFLLMSITLLLFSGNVHAAFNSGSTGALGAFNPTANTVVDLPADGILNYTTVNIPSGVTVTFKKNAANTPVYMLATGNVTISGTINVDGQASTSWPPGAGGTGGFDGGYGGTQASGSGLGPGGGGGGPNTSYPYGGGGGFATAGGSAGASHGAGGSTYGNASLIPLIGGSGGGGSAYSAGGGGGGGAILIASSGTITLNNGTITANGGNGYNYGGGGSGGAVKLMANTITGNGSINAKGGNYGGAGRIRIEADIRTFSFTTNPSYSFGLPGSVFISNMPTLKITSIGGINVPDNPKGSYSQIDVLLPSTTTNPVTVTVSATNIPVGTTITVSVSPQLGSSSKVTGALSGSLSSSTASVNINIPTANYFTLLTAQATFTVQTAMYWEDEKIEKVRVATKMGGGSEVTYITESGKEIPAEMMLAKAMK